MEKGTALLSTLFAIFLLGFTIFITLENGKITLLTNAAFINYSNFLNDALNKPSSAICTEYQEHSKAIPFKKTICAVTESKNNFPLLNSQFATIVTIPCPLKTTTIHTTALQSDNESIISTKTCTSFTSNAESIKFDGNLLSTTPVRIAAQKIFVQGSLNISELTLIHDSILFAAGSIRINKIKSDGSNKKIYLISATGSITVLELDPLIELYSLAWLGIAVPRTLPINPDTLFLAQKSFGIGIY